MSISSSIEPIWSKLAQRWHRCGFIFRKSAGITMFLDGPDAKPRDAVHVVFSGEKVRDEYPAVVPARDAYVQIMIMRTLPLAASSGCG